MEVRRYGGSTIYFLYTILFASSLVAINPWGANLTLLGTGRAEIWTHPKVATVALITLLNFYQLVVNSHHQKKDTLPCLQCNIFSVLWINFLLAATISTLFSPFPLNSLLGQSVLGDGLLYWALIAAFACSNLLLLKIKPELFDAQLNGLLIGGSIVALSTLPQIMDWRIDYTVTSGQVSVIDQQLLESGIWQMQMPIGLYSNRGHVAFVVASILGLSLVTIWKKWRSFRLSIFCCSLLSIALVGTEIRAGILSLFIGIIYLFSSQRIRAKSFPGYQLLRSKFANIIIAVILLYFAYVAYLSLKEVVVTEVDTFEFLEESLTGRIYLWILALKGAAQRFWIGWGFNGFGIAHLYVGDWSGRLSSYIPDGSRITKILSIYESTFDFLGTDGEIHTGTLLTHKAHNLFLDLMLSTGIWGLTSYSVLFGVCLWRIIRSHLWPLAVVPVIYLAFTQSWFEAAQFTHIPWWVLSLSTTATDIENT